MPFLHDSPLVRIDSSALEVDSAGQPSPGIVRSVFIDTSADDLVIVTKKNTVHFCRISSLHNVGDSGEQQQYMPDTLTIHPNRASTSARRFVTRTNPKLHGGLCAITHDAEKIFIFNAQRTSTPFGSFSCQPNSLRFREPFYPVLRFEWVPQRVSGYDPGRIYMLIACSVCIELIQVFPMAGSPDTAVRKLQRFVTTTDFCAVDATSRRLSMLSMNSNRKGVLKFFVVNDPVAEAQHVRMFGAASGSHADESSSFGAAAAASSSVSASGNNNSAGAAGTNSDPTIEHHLEIKIDDEPVDDPQAQFREMYPDPAQRKRGINYFIRLVTLYAEHYAAVVTRSNDVVLYRYDTSIPYFAVRREERPLRAFVLTLPQTDKYSLMVLDNEIVMQSLNPPFLCFTFDTSLDASTLKLRDRELVECMRRVSASSGPAAGTGGGGSLSRAASPAGGGGAAVAASTHVLHSSSTASGPTLLAHQSFPMPAPNVASASAGGQSGSGGGGGASSSAAGASSSGGGGDSIGKTGATDSSSAFSKLFSIPTLHVSPTSNVKLEALRPHVPEPLERLPIADLPGGGGIFCGCSEPVFLSLGTTLLNSLAAGQQTSLPSSTNNKGAAAAAATTSSGKVQATAANSAAQAPPEGVEVYLIGRKQRREWLHTGPMTLAARGGSMGKSNFKHLFAAAIQSQQSLTDIEKLLDESVAGFIVASCAIEPPVANSGLRVVGRWALDHGLPASSSSNTAGTLTQPSRQQQQRAVPAPWTKLLLSEEQIRDAEHDTSGDSEIISTVNLKREATTTTSSSSPAQKDSGSSAAAGASSPQQQQRKQRANMRGRRGRLESSLPLAVAGVSSDTIAPAAHLQLIIADVLSEHLSAALVPPHAAAGGSQKKAATASSSSEGTTSSSATVKKDETAPAASIDIDSRRLRYLRGVALEALRCFRCLVISPLQQVVVESFVCGGEAHMDLWGLLQLISFRFLAESPALAQKLIQVGASVRLRQLVQAGLDMLGRLGAHSEMATALLQLGDLLAAVRIAVKYELQSVAAAALTQAHAMDLEFSCEGKLCFSAASRRKLFPLVLAMLRTKNNSFSHVVESTTQRLGVEEKRGFVTRR